MGEFFEYFLPVFLSELGYNLGLACAALGSLAVAYFIFIHSQKTDTYYDHFGAASLSSF